MAAIDKLKKKNTPQVSIALMRMKPMKNTMPSDMEEDAAEGEKDQPEPAATEDSYGECPKCAEYEMLIGKALAAYMKSEEDSNQSESEKA
jgi:hypothetical protein